MFDDWRLRRYPELAVCDTTAEQAEVARICSDRAYGALRGRFAIALGLIAALTAVTIRYALWPALSKAMPDLIDPEPSGVALAAVVGAFLFAAHRMFMAPRLQREIRRELAARGYRLCIHCGYDLRGQTELRCPECGLAFPPPKKMAPSNPPSPGTPEA